MQIYTLVDTQGSIYSINVTDLIKRATIYLKMARKLSLWYSSLVLCNHILLCNKILYSTSQWELILANGKRPKYIPLKLEQARAPQCRTPGSSGKYRFMH